MTLWLKTLIPEALVIRKSSVLSRAIDTRTISPTFSCDHLTSCWLGIELLEDLSSVRVNRTCHTVKPSYQRLASQNVRRLGLLMQDQAVAMLHLILGDDYGHR